MMVGSRGGREWGKCVEHREQSREEEEPVKEEGRQLKREKYSVGARWEEEGGVGAQRSLGSLQDGTWTGGDISRE